MTLYQLYTPSRPVLCNAVHLLLAGSLNLDLLKAHQSRGLFVDVKPDEL